MILLSVGQEDIISILTQNRLTIFVDLVEGHPNLHRTQYKFAVCSTTYLVSKLMHSDSSKSLARRRLGRNWLLGQ